MNEILEPPAERDLPPETAARMRAHVLRMVAHSRTQVRDDLPVRGAARRTRTKLAVTMSLVLTVTIGAVAGMAGRDTPDNHGVQVLAMGPGELSPTLRDAAEHCLEWIHELGPDSAERPRRGVPLPGREERLPVSLADLAVAIERDHRTLILFLNDVGYATCDRETSGREPSGGISADRWAKDDWLPGPVQRLLLTSTEADGGQVSVSGRVSRRVDRLVLDHGDGRQTTARLSDGAFGLLTRHALRQENDPELVSYDAAGAEIDRRPLFQPEDQLAHCYVTPSGAVVYGRPGTGCLPAERWER